MSICGCAVRNGSAGCWPRWRHQDSKRRSSWWPCQSAGPYRVIDGYKRIAALEQLGRDTVEAVVWPMSEADALVLDRSMRFSEPETALEQGWLLAELEHRFGYSLEDLARRFDRSVSWVSRRLALVELLPESVQQHVRNGKISAHVAMKFLAPVARADPGAASVWPMLFPTPLQQPSSR